MLIQEAPALVTVGYACLLEDMKIKVVMRWQRSSSLLSHNMSKLRIRSLCGQLQAVVISEKKKQP